MRLLMHRCMPMKMDARVDLVRYPSPPPPRKRNGFDISREVSASSPFDARASITNPSDDPPLVVDSSSDETQSMTSSSPAAIPTGDSSSGRRSDCDFFAARSNSHLSLLFSLSNPTFSSTARSNSARTSRESIKSRLCARTTDRRSSSALATTRSSALPARFASSLDSQNPSRVRSFPTDAANIDPTTGASILWFTRVAVVVGIVVSCVLLFVRTRNPSDVRGRSRIPNDDDDPGSPLTRNVGSYS
jgi:hypothetical protein